MELTNTIRNKMREFLQITETTIPAITVEQTYTHTNLCNVEEIMYRSEPRELEQCFKAMQLDNAMFWAAVPSRKRRIRKRSAHMFPDILDRQNDILISSMNMPEFADVNDKALFEQIFDYNNGQAFIDIIKKIDLQTMLKGDCFLKATIDTEVSPFPILEVFPAERGELVYKRNILDSIKFYTEYKKNRRKYLLEETYGKGYINYILYNEDNKEVPLDTIEELADLKNITFEGNYIMATFLKYWDSPRFEHRGNPLITDFDAFDALDEVYSLWNTGLRRSQPNRYIPLNKVPRNREGQTMEPNDFDNDFFTTNGGMSEKDDRIEISQPSFDYPCYEVTSINFKLECMRAGKISPVSMAIDRNKYEDNATADRQKEKMTEWTRAQRIDKLMIFIPEMINMVLNTYANMVGGSIVDHKIEASFDEFSSPTIEDVVDVLSKAAPGTVLFSTETIVEMTAKALNKDEEWQKQEVERLNKNDLMYEETPFPTDDAIVEA